MSTTLVILGKNGYLPPQKPCYIDTACLNVLFFLFVIGETSRQTVNSCAWKHGMFYDRCDRKDSFVLCVTTACYSLCERVRGWERQFNLWKTATKKREQQYVEQMKAFGYLKKNGLSKVSLIWIYSLRPYYIFWDFIVGLPACIIIIYSFDSMYICEYECFYAVYRLKLHMWDMFGLSGKFYNFISGSD